MTRSTSGGASGGTPLALTSAFDIIARQGDSVWQEKLSTFLIIKGKMISNFVEDHEKINKSLREYLSEKIAPTSDRTPEVQDRMMKLITLMCNFFVFYNGNHAIREFAASATDLERVFLYVNSEDKLKGSLKVHPNYTLSDFINDLKSTPSHDIKRDIRFDHASDLLCLLEKDRRELLYTDGEKIGNFVSAVRLDDEWLLNQLNCSCKFNEATKEWIFKANDGWADVRNRKVLLELFSNSEPYSRFLCDDIFNEKAIEKGAFAFRDLSIYRCYDSVKKDFIFISLGQIYDKLLYAISLQKASGNEQFSHEELISRFLKRYQFGSDVPSLIEKLYSDDTKVAIANAVSEYRGIGLDSIEVLCNVTCSSGFKDYLSRKIGIAKENISVEKGIVRISQEFSDDIKLDDFSSLSFVRNDTKRFDGVHAVFEIRINDVIKFESDELRKLRDVCNYMAMVEREEEVEGGIISDAVYRSKHVVETMTPPIDPKLARSKEVTNFLKEIKKIVKEKLKTQVGGFFPAEKDFAKKDSDKFAVCVISDANLIKYFKEKSFSYSDPQSLILEEDGSVNRLFIRRELPENLTKEIADLQEFLSSKYEAWLKDEVAKQDEVKEANAKRLEAKKQAAKDAKLLEQRKKEEAQKQAELKAQQERNKKEDDKRKKQERKAKEEAEKKAKKKAAKEENRQRRGLEEEGRRKAEEEEGKRKEAIEVIKPLLRKAVQRHRMVKDEEAKIIAAEKAVKDELEKELREKERLIEEKFQEFRGEVNALLNNFTINVASEEERNERAQARVEYLLESQLKPIIDNAKTKGELLLQGSFVYGNKPQDIDIILILEDRDFKVMTDDELQKTFSDIVGNPLNTKIEIKSNVMRADGFRLPYKSFKIGDVDFVIGNRSYYENSLNCTCKIDAMVYNFNKEEIEYKKAFLDSGRNPNFSNKSADDFHLRLVRCYYPNRVPDCFKEDLENSLFSEILRKGGEIKGIEFVMSRIEDFTTKHKIFGSDKVNFDRNVYGNLLNVVNKNFSHLLESSEEWKECYKKLENAFYSRGKEILKDAAEFISAPVSAPKAKPIAASRHKSIAI